ncbi:MAG: hypothetical protein CMJ18_13910 [Phycisphaeraceae bacterium]|nr:hypothetical protein [Phycisphaeraceae bacterium]
MEATAAGETRQNRRYTVRCEARVEPLDERSIGKDVFDAVVMDMSRTGVMLRVDRPLPQGSLWRIRFIDRNHVIGMTPIMVRYTRDLEAGDHLVGGQFTIEPYILA